MTVAIQFPDKHNAPVTRWKHMKTSYLLDVYLKNKHEWAMSTTPMRKDQRHTPRACTWTFTALDSCRSHPQIQPDFAAKAHMLLHPIFDHCAIFPLPKVWRKMAGQHGRQIDKSNHFQGMRSWSCVNCRHVSTVPLHSVMSSLSGNSLGSWLEWGHADSVWQGLILFLCMTYYL